MLGKIVLSFSLFLSVQLSFAGTRVGLHESSNEAISAGAINTLTGVTFDSLAAAASGSIFGSGMAPVFRAIAGQEYMQAVENFKSGVVYSDSGNYVDTYGANGINSGAGLNLNDPSDFDQMISDSGLETEFGSFENPFTKAEQLKKDGFKINKDGSVTGTDGKTYSKSQMQNAAKKVLATKEFQDKQKKLYAKRKSYLNRIGRMNANNKGGYLNANARSGAKAQKNPFNFNFGLNNKKPASAFGPTKIVNGDPVGAAEDNVFHIVERAYEGLVGDKSLREKIPKQK